MVAIRLANANPQIPKKKANPERPAAKIGAHVRNGVFVKILDENSTTCSNLRCQ